MFRYLIAGCALTWAVAGHAAESESAFSTRLLALLQAASPDRQMHVGADDPLTIEVETGDEGEIGTINLHRIYGFCQRATQEECDRLASEFVSRITVVPPKPTAANLRLIVRDGEYLEYVGGTLPEPNRPPHRQIGDDLFAILAFDSPTAITLANRELLTGLGLDEAAAWRLAEAQTKAILPPLPNGADLAREPAVFQEREYLPSMLADTAAWRAIAQSAGPDMFVTAVSDGMVFVGVMPDGARLEEFKQVVREDCDAQERCVTPNVYRFRDGRWVVAD